MIKGIGFGASAFWAWSIGSALGLLLWEWKSFVKIFSEGV